MASQNRSDWRLVYPVDRPRQEELPGCIHVAGVAEAPGRKRVMQ